MEPANASNQGDAVSSEGLDNLRKALQRVEGNLIRRIAANEAQLAKISDLEDDMVQVKIDVKNALKPKEPAISLDDVQRWN